MINIAICDNDILTTTFIEESVYKLAEKADIKVNDFIQSSASFMRTCLSKSNNMVKTSVLLFVGLSVE